MCQKSTGRRVVSWIHILLLPVVALCTVQAGETGTVQEKAQTRQQPYATGHTINTRNTRSPAKSTCLRAHADSMYVLLSVHCTI